MARAERPDLAPGVYIENGTLYYKGQELPRTVLGNTNTLNQQIARINEEQARAQTKQAGESLAGQQQTLAEEFRSNIPKYTGLLQDQSKKTIQRDLAENMAGLKQRSSSAGFLKGSGTQKQQAEALAGAQTQTMAKDLDIADTIESQAKQFENQALATKMSLQGSANQSALDALRQNIIDTQRQSELWKSLGSVVGSGIGSYYGRKA